MQTLLIPLRLKHVANDALIKSLKDTALSLPRTPGKQLEAEITGCVCGRWPTTRVSFPLLNLMLQQQLQVTLRLTISLL